MKTHFVFAVHTTGLDEHVRTSGTSGQAWNTSEQGHGLGEWSSGGFSEESV